MRACPATVYDKIILNMIQPHRIYCGIKRTIKKAINPTMTNHLNVVLAIFRTSIAMSTQTTNATISAITISSYLPDTI